MKRIGFNRLFESKKHFFARRSKQQTFKIKTSFLIQRNTFFDQCILKKFRPECSIKNC